MALNNLGLGSRSAGEFAAAEPLLPAAVEVLRRTAGESDVLFGVVVNNLAMLYARHEELPGRPAAGEARRWTSAGPPWANSTLILPGAWTTRGTLRRDGQPAGRAACRSAASARDPPGERWRGAPGLREELNNLATVLSALGDHAGAMRLCEQTASVMRGAVGERHPDVATALGNSRSSRGGA